MEGIGLSQHVAPGHGGKRDLNACHGACMEGRLVSIGHDCIPCGGVEAVHGGEDFTLTGGGERTHVMHGMPNAWVMRMEIAWRGRYCRG